VNTSPASAITIECWLGNLFCATEFTAPGKETLPLPPHDQNHPYPARIVENQILSGEGSEKETRHFVLDITGSGLTYKVGDSLGVFPSNDPELVAEILSLLGARGDELVVVPRDPDPVSFHDALFSRLSLAQPTVKSLQFLAGKTSDASERETLTALLDPTARDSTRAFLAEREHVDLLDEFPHARPNPQEFVAQLRRLVPRLYSIASSPRVYPHEVHLTVRVVRCVTNNRQRGGVCTTFKADRTQVFETLVPVFVVHSHFGLPDDDAADVIMIGPGTGVAPFRAFLQERKARGAVGRNWLFFGEQRQATDFCYGEEFGAFQRDGVLQRLDTAFSRDQPTKVYVQDRMGENGAELWSWLEAGAYFYVCGDAKRMAKDVDRVLHEIVGEHGGVSSPGDYVKAMRKERRYQRDVY